MEATFYEDTRYRGGVGGGGPQMKDDMSTVGRTMKRPMTLDLDSSRFNKKPKVTLLTSPDLNMLKLGSPELERMIIAQHCLPTSTTPSQCMFPNSKVSDDREFGIREFPDALSSLQPPTTTSNMYNTQQQQHHHHHSMPPEISILPCNNPPPPPTCMDGGNYYQTSSNCNNNNNNNNIPSTSSGLMPSTSQQQQQHHQQQQSGMSNCYPSPPNYYMPPSNLTIKEEPQTVPCMGVTPPLSPIDMENQEKIKLERKRLRNRIAASKCRRRKLERIARLEEKVSMLKGENSELTNIVTALREQVCNLKQQVMDHVRCGCEILNYRPDLAQF